MSVFCAWCGTSLESSVDPETAPPGWVSHGICSSCAARLLNESGTALDEFIAGLGVPVLLVGDNLEVDAANDAAVEMIGKRPETFLGKLGGDVFECVNADLPGGCGRTVHCSGCALRQTVTATYEDGRPRVRVPATLRVQTEDEPTLIELYISTAKVSGRVLLRVDPAEKTSTTG